MNFSTVRYKIMHFSEINFPMDPLMYDWNINKTI